MNLQYSEWFYNILKESSVVSYHASPLVCTVECSPSLPGCVTWLKMLVLVFYENAASSVFYGADTDRSYRRCCLSCPPEEIRPFPGESRPPFPGDARRWPPEGARGPAGAAGPWPAPGAAGAAGAPQPANHSLLINCWLHPAAFEVSSESGNWCIQLFPPVFITCISRSSLFLKLVTIKAESMR